MSYKSWFIEHSKKHKEIVRRLKTNGFSDEMIVDYFEYENMRENEADFCPLYGENKKCHDIKYLNCYLCACPNFRFSDDGLKISDGANIYSECAILSKDGVQRNYNGQIHQDCSDCAVPHEKEYISKNFDSDWLRIMNRCEKQ